MAVAGLLVAGTFATSPAQAAGTAQVSVVHGIPNTPVNVFVNDKLTLPDFKTGTVAGPLSLLGGSYTVTVFPAADTAGAGTPVIKATATIQAGHSYSLVAHLTTAGKPALTAFVNDTSAMPAGMGRLIVRHVAAAPTVDVRANGKVAFPGLTNPHEAKANLPAGSISADVVLAGTSTVVLGPANVTVAEGQDTIRVRDRLGRRKNTCRGRANDLRAEQPTRRRTYRHRRPRRDQSRPPTGCGMAR
jgi:hypothetical protein